MGKVAKKTKTSKKKNLLELGIIVSDRVQLVDVRLIRCNCHQTPLAQQGNQSVDIDYAYSTKTLLQKQNNCILVFPSFKMKIVPNESKDKETSLAIEADFLLVYSIDDLEGIKEENIKAFGEANGIYNAWPYWREFVQNTIARMGLPQLTIPVFRITSSPKKKKNKPASRPRKKAIPKAIVDQKKQIGS